MLALVVDDNLIARRSLIGFLGTFAFCDTAVNGFAALEAVALQLRCGQRYDLICLDLWMPSLGGLETLDRIRKLESESGLAEGQGSRVVILTAAEDEETRREAVQRGCDAFLRKPYTQEILMSTLRALGLVGLQGVRERPALDEAHLFSEMMASLRRLLGSDEAFVEAAMDSYLTRAGELITEIEAHLERGSSAAAAEIAAQLGRFSVDTAVRPMADLSRDLVKSALDHDAEGASRVLLATKRIIEAFDGRLASSRATRAEERSAARPDAPR